MGSSRVQNKAREIIINSEYTTLIDLFPSTKQIRVRGTLGIGRKLYVTFPGPDFF